ncbi:MAG: hypothetical protein EX262_03315 [Sphingomonadaceae bacterium]|nr:MAG: hypothetical protein EX262_03315 [Sphingomonadaceae bacterium]
MAADDAVEPNAPGSPAPESSTGEESTAIPVLVDIERDRFLSLTDEFSSVGGESGLKLSGNVALVSDYRFRGVSFSDGDIALQGGIDLGHPSGLYAGTWASTISGGSDFGELELDVYAGWSGDVSDGVTLDVGLLYYIYPTGDAPGVDTDYFEPYASIGTTLGPVGATVGVAYAWEQDSLGGGDNLYLYTDFELGIPQTPITLTAHLGYTDGVFATALDGDSFDWGIGVSYAITGNLSLGLNYVDTQGPSIEDFTDAGFFASITYSM